MKTLNLTVQTVEKKWYVIDAEGMVLGRLATLVAGRLRGKHKTTYSPHLDGGDFIVIINAEKVRISGKKASGDVFYWHTGHPGGLKELTKGQILNGKFPERLIKKAVERMVPTNVLGRQQMSHLRVYAGSEHPHAAQNPEVLDLASQNIKNTRVSARTA